MVALQSRIPTCRARQEHMMLAQVVCLACGGRNHVRQQKVQKSVLTAKAAHEQTHRSSAANEGDRASISAADSVPGSRSPSCMRKAKACFMASATRCDPRLLGPPRGATYPAHAKAEDAEPLTCKHLQKQTAPCC